MTEAERGWSDDAHRYAEGAGAPPDGAAERAGVDRFVAAVQAYRNGLPSLGDELDVRIMAGVRARPRPVRVTGWRWLVAPRAVSVRAMALKCTSSPSL